MKSFFNIFLLLIVSFNLLAENVKWERSLSIGTSSLNSSSLFDIIGTTKGSRPYPSMTQTQRNNITSPATGLTIFNTTSNELNIYNGSSWTVVANTDQAQTFTNKTIVGTANSISGLRHGTEVDNTSSGVHGVTGNVVGATDIQTLTNKTIAATANTISGLRHGFEVDSPSSGVHGLTGSVIGTTDTQTMSNKSFSDAVSYAKISIPASPATGFLKLYAKSDDRFYKLDSSGNEKSISPVFTPSTGGVFVSDGTPDSFTLVGTGLAGQYLRSSGTSPPTWSDVFTFTPSAGNIFYSQGTPGAFSLTTTGTPGQYLQSNGSSAPTWTTVSGGGGAVYTPSSGSIFYSDNTTTLRLTTVGTPNQLLQSNGAGTPNWTSAPTLTSVTVSPGAASSPSYTFTGDLDTGIYNSTNLVGISTNGSSKLTIDSTGRIAGSAGINRSLSTTQDTSQTTTYYVESGTYSPTITGVANTTTVSSPGLCFWMRVANAVTVWGEFTATGTTGTTLTQVSISIPVASGFSTNTEAFGFIARRSTGTNMGSIDMRNSNDDVVASWILSSSDAGASRTFGFHFSYFIVP